MYWLNPKFTDEDFDQECANLVDNGYTLIRIMPWWEHIEEKRGQYNFKIVDSFMAAAAKHGLDVMYTLGIYPPVWLTEELHSLGKNDPGRYPSFQRQETLKPLAKFIEATVTRYRNAPALASWNVWNEPTLNNTKNEVTLALFAQWLKEKYPTLDALRDSWQCEHPCFSQPIPETYDQLDADWLAKAFKLFTRGRTAAIECDYQRFLPQLLCKEISWLCDQVKKYDTTHPTHTNFHSINSTPVHPSRDLYSASRCVDTFSCSMHQSNDNRGHFDMRDRKAFYNCGAERTHSWNKGGDAMVGELQVGTADIHQNQYTPTPDTIFYELWQSYATGLNGVIHWEWRGWRGGTFELGEFGLRAPADGGETPRSRKVKEFAKIFNDNRDVLLDAQRQKAKIAIYDSYNNAIYRFVQAVDHPDVPNLRMDHQDAAYACHRVLNEANFNVDFIYDQELEQGDLSQYKLIYLPETSLLNKRSAENLAAFVENGGAVWADGRFAWLDELMFLRQRIPGHNLQEVFAVREEEYTAQPGCATAVTTDGLNIQGRKLQQEYQLLRDATVHARYANGAVAAVDAQFGKGRTRIWGIEVCRRLRSEYMPDNEQEIVNFALEIGLTPEVQLPKGVIGRLLKGDNTDVLFLYNYTDSAKIVQLPERTTCICQPAENLPQLSINPFKTEIVLIER